MTITVLLSRYGLLGVFLGAGVEGEAVAIAGGMLAHRGLVPLWAAMAAAACGSCLVDQLWFLLGRHCRRYRRVQRIMARPAFARALDFLERHPTAFIFGFRFVYGMRTVSPIAIGTTTVPVARFILFNMAAAALWGPLFTYIGYVFGEAIEPLLHHVQADALLMVAAVAGIGIAAAAVRWWRMRAT